MLLIILLYTSSYFLRCIDLLAFFLYHTDGESLVLVVIESWSSGLFVETLVNRRALGGREPRRVTVLSGRKRPSRAMVHGDTACLKPPINVGL